MKSIYTFSVGITVSFLISAALAVGGAAFLTVTSATAEAQGAPLEISIKEFEKIYKANPKVNLLDVRTNGEFRQNHVPGSVLLDVNEIMSLGNKVQSKIPFAKNQPIYVICRSGNRSFTATRILRNMGYTQAVSVRGGVNAWSQIGNNCNTKFLACAR